MRIKHVQSSFLEGRLSPRLQGQVESDTYRSGLYELENAVVLPQGSITKRPGTFFAAQTKSNQVVKLVEFVFGRTDSYVLELGDQYIRFYKNDGQLLGYGTTTPYEIVSPYATADLEDLSWAQSADVILFTHPNYAPRKLERRTATTGTRADDGTVWSFDLIEFTDGPYGPVNTDDQKWLQIGGTTSDVEIGGIEVDSTFNTITLRNHNLFDGMIVGFTGSPNNANDSNHPHNYTVEAPDHLYYVINSTANTFQLTEEESGTPVSLAANVDYTATRVFKRIIAKGATDLTLSGYTSESGSTTYTQFTSSDVGRIVRVNALKTDQIYWGYGIITGVTNGVATLTAKSDIVAQSRTNEWQLGAWYAENWPQKVAIFQQRTVWAGSKEFPQTVWFSKSADFYNMAASEFAGVGTGNFSSTGAQIIGEQIADDNAVILTIDSDTVDKIVFVEVGRKLSIGTNGGIYNIYGSEQQITLTPFNFTIEQATAFPAHLGTNAIQVDRSLFFVQQNARKLREIDFAQQAEKQIVMDVSYKAEDVTAPGIVKIVSQLQPHGLIWCLLEDGKISCMTYNRDYKIQAWSKHYISGNSSEGSWGKVLDVINIPRGTHDQIWMLVERTTINGSINRSIEFLEKFYDKIETDPEDSHFVDCGISKVSGTAFSQVGDLGHLEGEEVWILGNGGVQTNKTVSSGVIDLETESTTAHVGLPYYSTVISLPLVQSGSGILVGVKKRIYQTAIRLFESLGVRVGPFSKEWVVSDLEEIVFRELDDKMGNSVPLFDGEKRVRIQGKGYDDVSENASVVLQSYQPLPMTLLYLSFDYTVNDD